MSDEQQIDSLYRQMYEAMVGKDTATLYKLHAKDFVLVHMTGMRQSREEYIKAISDGTLNYYNALHETVSINITGTTATLTGRSRVEAAVFGGGRHTWNLELRFRLRKEGDAWLLTEARAGLFN